MTVPAVRSAPVRVWLALLVLVAVLVRGTIPAGWMPNTSGDGRGPLMMCPAAGPVIAHHHDHHHHPGHPGPHADGHQDICAFAGLSAAPHPPPTVAAAPSEIIGAQRISLPPQSAPQLRQIHKEQAARAPPALI